VRRAGRPRIELVKKAGRKYAATIVPTLITAQDLVLALVAGVVGDEVADLVQDDVVLVRTGRLPLIEDDVHGFRHEPEPERPGHPDRTGHQADRPAALPGQALAVKSPMTSSKDMDLP
jgi:hypothetical protein